MTESWTTLAVEGLVAVLLVITICYCMTLDRRLRALKADRAALESIVAELVGATTAAERAVGTLKEAVAACDEELGAKLAAGTRMCEELAAHTDAAKGTLRRIVQHAAAPATPPAAVSAPVATAAPAPAVVDIAPAPRPHLSETVAAARSLAQRFQQRVQHGAAA